MTTPALDTSDVELSERLEIAGENDLLVERARETVARRYEWVVAWAAHRSGAA